jgi:predicted RNA-binding protein with PUA-like domain
MINKVTETTFQCDGCLEVKDNSEYRQVVVDGGLSEICSCCHADNRQGDSDDSDDYDDYDPSDDIYDRWKYNQMMMD